MNPQLVLEPVAASLHAAQIRRASRFIRRHRAAYRRMAAAITPDLTDWRAVWDRLAWAILTANASYGPTKEALSRAQVWRESLPARLFHGIPGMTPAKVDYLRGLPSGESTKRALREPGEPWTDYRIRLMGEVRGLALTKASYAVCMLYPLEADVACLDTWIQKLFTWTTAFRWLRREEYEAIEDQIRQLAKRHAINTALCQWLLWDMVRGTTTDQNVFTAAPAPPQGTSLAARSSWGAVSQTGERDAD